MGNLNGYLNEIGMKSEEYYYFKGYNHSIVAGAMALARVNGEPEKTRNFRALKISKR